MTTPDPVPPSSPTRISIDTTAGTVRAAMSATEPSGRSLLCTVWAIDGSGSVRSWAPSAVSRPTSPPAAPISTATSAERGQRPRLHAPAEQHLAHAQPGALAARRCRPSRRPPAAGRARPPRPGRATGPARRRRPRTPARPRRPGRCAGRPLQRRPSPAGGRTRWPARRGGRREPGRAGPAPAPVGGGETAVHPVRAAEVAAAPGSTAGRSSGRGPSRGGSSRPVARARRRRPRRGSRSSVIGAPRLAFDPLACLIIVPACSGTAESDRAPACRSAVKSA